ncbi:E3 ubiquitin-protein ligase TRIM7-like isoform X2 [Xenopus laevis]|nr:E3 ubiquitin-protein ligase TRIM7-like isoform X2 [Xenopus laevis]OCU02791.1 hypothetical protein XELAEV_18008561mg [Xenopus laevis]
MATADLIDELSCSICLSIYTDPVSLLCGHNFCRDCIGTTWDTQVGSGAYSCPECRAEYQERPALLRNRALRNIAERFLPTETQPGETGIFCTYCVLSPVPAAKSCLLCEASLCDTHLRGHSKSAEHVLTQPTDSFMGRKCSVHNELLKYFCCEESVCICVSCYMVGEHRGHRVELLSEASEKKKEKLRKVLEKLRSEREETERGAQRLQERRREVAEKAAGETERVTALFRDIREQLEALEKQLLSDISRQKEKLSLPLTDLMEQLEIKKDELSRKIRHIEELCNMADPLTVLQEWESHGAADNEGGRERHDIKVPAVGDLDVDLISETLLTGLAAIVTGVKGRIYGQEATDLLLDINKPSNATDIVHKPLIVPGACTTQVRGKDSIVAEVPGLCASFNREQLTITKSKGAYFCNILQKMAKSAGDPTTSTFESNRYDPLYGQEATDLLLDINTAGNLVSVSGDRKSASYSLTDQCHPQTPERFQFPQTLSSRSFPSGRHYWEVEVSESGGWGVGVAYPSIERRGGQSCIGSNNKSWCLYRWYNKYSVKHDNKFTQLPHVPSCRRIRISLDYEAGRLSFYELSEPIRHLHTFTVTFTEPLHAAFWVGGYKTCVRIINWGTAQQETHSHSCP